jgi:integrase
VSEILPLHITEFTNRAGTKPRGLRAKKNDYLALSSFFSWASQHVPCYCANNPMPKSNRVKIDQRDPEIMPLGTVHRLLDVASSYKDGRCLPYFTLGLFCALRPDEMDRITWRNIDLDDRIVTLGADIAKTRSKRHVEISDNAIEWLRPHALKKTEIGIGRYDFDAVRKLAGLKKWGVDILRHTAISHHLTAHQHEGKTALWAGNSPTIIQKHYKGLVKRQDAEAFWNIIPADASEKIVTLPTAV